jgi:hypothetical protein
MDRTDNTVHLLLCTCCVRVCWGAHLVATETLPSNDSYLQSHYLATAVYSCPAAGLHATIYFVVVVWQMAGWSTGSGVRNRTQCSNWLLYVNFSLEFSFCLLAATLDCCSVHAHGTKWMRIVCPGRVPVICGVDLSRRLVNIGYWGTSQFVPYN